MPIHEADPWRLQYFADVPCPADVHVPTEDSDAWQWHPAQHWIYDRLVVARSQGLLAAPHGVMPDRFPVFSKPIINLRGMGVGSQRIPTPAAYLRSVKPGHFWMELLTGAHVSSDFAVQEGRAVWSRHTTGIPAQRGTFDHWIIDATTNPAVEDYCGAWIARHLAGYTGMVNIETIGGRIIEAHLRFADQWPDLYGQGWVDAVIALYATGRWRFDDSNRRLGFSVVLFGPNGRRYRHPDASFVNIIRRSPGISSVQITFHEDRDPRRHAMPPGGFRLAIVNCHDLAAGRGAREALRQSFMTQGTSEAVDPQQEIAHA